MTDRCMNFGAGPAAMPLAVLQEAAAELTSFGGPLSSGGTGRSILETSHRSPEYDAVHQQARLALRQALGLGENYQVLFFGGGATTQFALVPMNLLGGGTADYVVTGSWSKKALAEAKKTACGKVVVAATTERDGRFERIPAPSEIKPTPGARYLHVTSNNTIFGTQWATLPDAEAPLVVDMSSDILARQLDLSRCGLIYAGAQKNLGPAGVTVVVIRNDVLASCRSDLPSMFSYQVQAEKGSLVNTPPAFAIYLLGKTLQWIADQGGVAAVEQQNCAKGERLYGVIDRYADFYRAPVAHDSRSLMNVVFRLPDAALEARLLKEAAARQMTGLKGHRSVGGLRVSMYNAVPLQWVEALAQLMEEFAERNG